MAATGKKNGKTVVVALGGNAILQPGQVGTFEEQLFNIDGAMRRIARARRGRLARRAHARQRPAGRQPADPERARRQDGGADADGRLRRREPGPDRLHGRPDPGQPPAQAQARRAGGDDRHPGRGRPQGQGLREPEQAGRPLLLRGRGAQDDARGGPRHARGRRPRLARASCPAPSPARSSSSRPSATCVDERRASSSAPAAAACRWCAAAARSPASTR